MILQLNDLGPASVAELYEAHFEFVWRVLRRLGVQPLQLEDAVQDVFVVVQRRISDFEQRAAWKTWLFGIAWRVAKAYRAHHARRALETDGFEEGLVGTSPDPQQAAAETEAAGIVQSLLDTLEENRRVVFVMAELEDFTGAEIAESLQINVNTVYSRLRLARRDFEAGARRLRARGKWRAS